MNTAMNRRQVLKTAFASVAAAALARQAAAAQSDIHFAKDPKNLQPGLEAAHTPGIALEKLDAQALLVGKTPAGEFYRVTVQARHEATQPHHIFAIQLWVNGDLVAEHKVPEGQAETSLPAASFFQRLKTGDELLAVTVCNVHGQWGNRISIQS